MNTSEGLYGLCFGSEVNLGRRYNPTFACPCCDLEWATSETEREIRVPQHTPKYGKEFKFEKEDD
jgi:hypothetical protein